jgi:hypothetical protein
MLQKSELPGHSSKGLEGCQACAYNCRAFKEIEYLDTTG